VIALTELHGIGKSTSQEVLNKLKISEDTRTNQLTGDEEKKIRDYIENNLRVEGDLRREVTKNVKHKIDVGTYSGTRHQRSLPVRGQRTRTNSRTVRGNVRRTAGSGRRPAAEKT
jgi:small subunit ribosomal protein S13